MIVPGKSLHLTLSVTGAAPRRSQSLYSEACRVAQAQGSKPPHPRHFEEHLETLATFGLLELAPDGWQTTDAGESRLLQLGPWGAQECRSVIPVTLPAPVRYAPEQPAGQRVTDQKGTPRLRSRKPNQGAMKNPLPLSVFPDGNPGA